MLIGFLLVVVNRVFGLGYGGFFSFFRVDFKSLGQMLHQTMIQPSQLGAFFLVGFLVLLLLATLWYVDCSHRAKKFRLRTVLAGFYVVLLVCSYCTVRLLVYKESSFFQSIELSVVPFKGRIIPSNHIAEFPLAFGKNTAAYTTQRCDPCQEDDPGLLPRNIVIYIIESIPVDYINQEDTPNIFQFRAQARNFKNAFAPSNSTHNSVFSIFTGVSPFRFVEVTRDLPWKASPPVQVFKDLGYKIRLFNTEPYYEYLNVLKAAFGPNYESVDEKFTLKTYKAAPDRDQNLLRGMHHSLEQNAGAGRNVFVVFLDSTHHNYFFPDSFNRKKIPLIEEFNYLKWDYSPDDLQLIRNRYITSLRFMDSIVGESLETLKKLGVYDNSTIALVADHGEEFMEFGSLIHGSNLRNPQMKVPFIIKHADVSENFEDLTMVSTLDLVPNLFPKSKKVHSWLEQSSNAASVATRLKEGFTVTANSRSALVPNIFAVNTIDQTLEFELDEQSPIDAITAKLKNVWVDSNSRKLQVDDSYVSDRIIPLLCGESFDDMFFRCRK
jgi:glucan phosphoethanolaminetransferase (alkaline phosphatase superfamily)